MPIRKIGPQTRTKYPEITARLVQEIRNPAKEEDATEKDPFIIEETIGKGPLKHILVIWDIWEKVPENERGAAIMDAYEEVYGSDSIQDIALVMAMTYKEAGNLNAWIPKKTNEEKEN